MKTILSLLFIVLSITFISAQTGGGTIPDGSGLPDGSGGGGGPVKGETPTPCQPVNGWMEATNSNVFNTINTGISLCGNYNKVGINTISPTYSLDVHGTIRSTGLLFPNLGIQFSDGTTQTTAYIPQNGIQASYLQAFDYIKLGTNSLFITNGTAGQALPGGCSSTGYEMFATNGAIKIQSNTCSGNNHTILNEYGGNAGIGTSTPSQKLDVTGNINFSGDLYQGGSRLIHTTGTDNYFFGNDVASNLGTGFSNIGIGKFSFFLAQQGYNNVAIGTKSLGFGQNIGVLNVAIGTEALQINGISGFGGSKNVALGANSMNGSVGGSSNVAAGYQSLGGAQNNKTIAVGEYALGGTGNSNESIAIGYRALYAFSGTWALGQGEYNTVIGSRAGYNNGTGSRNVFLGNQAGYDNQGNLNVFLGNGAGYNETGSEKLYIANSGTATPLIYGDFAQQQLTFNGSATITSNVVLPGITQDNTKTRVLVSDATGNVGWRTDTDLPGDNLGNHIATQHIVPDNDDSYDLGSSATSFRNIHFDQIIYKNSESFIHTTGTKNFFAGQSAGVNNNAGKENTACGYNALLTSSGEGNSAVGTEAMSKSTSNLSKRNTAVGAFSLQNNLLSDNTAVGYWAMKSNTGGKDNVAIGSESMIKNTGGKSNVASGYQALYNNDTGNYNSTSGAESMFNNIDGNNNVTSGFQSLWRNKHGSKNVAIGRYSMQNSEQGDDNVAIGDESMGGGYGINVNFFNYGSENTATGARTLQFNTTGSYNTTAGAESMRFNNKGSLNTAMGYKALHGNTNGIENVALGAFSLADNYSGYANTAIGNNSLSSNDDSYYNTAVGFSSMVSNTIGNNNCALGAFSLNDNIAGERNVAVGYEALLSNINGNNNTATGYLAMQNNESGISNVAVGAFSLLENVNANMNTAIGLSALRNNQGEGNTGIGAFSLYYNTTGVYNTALGFGAGPLTNYYINNSTSIGSFTTPTASNQIRLGNLAVSTIGGIVIWTTLSDGRFKDNVKEDVAGLEFIKKLRPVSYSVNRTRMNKFIAGENEQEEAYLKMVAEADEQLKDHRYTGFIAQEVEEIVQENNYVFDGVDAPDNDNDHYGLKYAEFVVPLVKSVQELNQKDDELQNQVDLLTAEVEQLQKQLAAQSSSTTTDIEVIGQSGIKLYQNTPNPFDIDTEIKMELTKNITEASIYIYDLQGKQIKQIIINERGNTSIKINGGDLDAGMYVYALITDGKVIDTKRMILTR